MFVCGRPKNEVDMLIAGMSGHIVTTASQATNIVKEEAAKAPRAILN